MGIDLPFVHLNLHKNPFGSLTLDEQAQLAIVDVDFFVEQLKCGPFRVQFLGDCGAGKTTHLLAIRKCFSDAPYFHFAEGAPIPKIPQAPLLFLDETQRLPRQLLKSLLSQKISLVIATHRNHSKILRRANIPFESVKLNGLSDEKLQTWIESRIEAVRRQPGAIPQLEPHAAAKLRQKFGRDLRAIEDHLYDVFQSLEDIGHVTV